tara:strand:+ start:59 stop:544 length:486 start_codon:yes stop_codon:yes gene_type:complete
MSDLEASSEDTVAATNRWWQRIPMLRVVVLTVAFLLIGEQFPFSYFPMYSSFDPRTEYYFVADQSGSPLACIEVFGTSTANVKKMYRTRLRELISHRGAKELEATLSEREIIGREMLVYLRELGVRSGREVPDDVIMLKRVVVERIHTGEIMKRETIVAQG